MVKNKYLFRLVIMQRTPRQGALMVNKDKDQPWSNAVISSSSLPSHRPTNMADLESRVAAAEKFNQQILHDIVDLKEELHLSRTRFAGRRKHIVGQLAGYFN